MKLVISSILVGSAASFTPSSFINGGGVSHKVASSTSLDMKYKVAVVGGGPSGACAAEIFAKEKNVDTVLFERKMDNAKPCGGAIPLCMIGEFDIPETTVDRKVSWQIFYFIAVWGGVVRVRAAAEKDASMEMDGFVLVFFYGGDRRGGVRVGRLFRRGGEGRDPRPPDRAEKEQ